MKKIFSIACLLLLGAGMTASAQITEGNPTGNQITTGNRPQAGTWGIYLGSTSNMFKAIGDKDTKIDPLPLINLKYMFKDKWEARLGLEFSRKRETVKGDLITGYDENEKVETASYKNKVVTSENRIMPGVAYHFSPKNILDVYAGVEATLGWSRNSLYNDFQAEDEDGKMKDGYNNVCKSSVLLGGGAFIGLQAFIGNLPLAIGLEYGISCQYDSRLRYKNTFKEPGSKEQVVYSANVEDFPELANKGVNFNESDAYDSLKASKGKIGQQFRLTISYYFR